MPGKHYSIRDNIQDTAMHIMIHNLLDRIPPNIAASWATFTPEASEQRVRSTCYDVLNRNVERKSKLNQHTQ